MGSKRARKEPTKAPPRKSKSSTDAMKPKMQLPTVSTEAFKGKSDEEILAEARRLQAERGLRRELNAENKPASVSSPRETCEDAIRRVESTFTGMNAAMGQAERTRRIAAEDQERAQRRAVDLLLKSAAPELQSGRAMFEEGTARAKAWRAALAKITAMPENLEVALLGDEGRGKTQIAVEIIKAFTARGRSALWTTATDFFMAIKA
jgi:DNA replication protein DnaC